MEFLQDIFNVLMKYPQSGYIMIGFVLGLITARYIIQKIYSFIIIGLIGLILGSSVIGGSIFSDEPDKQTSEMSEKAKEKDGQIKVKDLIEKALKQ